MSFFLFPCGAIRLTSCFVYRLVGALASDAQAADESEDGVCLLSAETAQSAVRALCDTAGLLLEYLENVLDDGTDVTGDPDTRLAVTRAVGSFLAELPDPHASRLDSILPSSCRTTRHPARCARTRRHGR